MQEEQMIIYPIVILANDVGSINFWGVVAEVEIKLSIILILLNMEEPEKNA